MAAGGVDELGNDVVQRLGFQRAQIHADQVGLLARFDRTDAIAVAQRARAAESGRMQRGRGVQRGGVVRHRLGQLRRGAGLAEHVQVVVAGAAVGADGQVDARALQRAGRAETGGQLEVGFRAMHHRHAALGAQVDLGLGQLGHVHRDQAVVDQAQAIQARQWTLAILLQRIGDFLRGLVGVQVHRHVELVREHAHALEVGVADRIRCVRRERGVDQRIAAPLIMDLARAVEIFVAGLGPGGREIDHRQADPRAEAVALVDRGLHIGEEVVFVGTGGAAAQHLGDRQGGTVGDELRADHRRFHRPDVLLQPLHERQIIGDAAQQRHRIVGMRVDQTGQQRRIRSRHHPLRHEALARVGNWQDGEDVAALHRHRMVFQHHPMWHHRDDETGLNEEIASFGAGVVGHASSYPWFRGEPESGQRFTASMLPVGGGSARIGALTSPPPGISRRPGGNRDPS